MSQYSPFKFLDAYEADDYDRFFGRERETAQLYNAVFASHLTLLYGGSGTGKTSLVKCGLANKFYETDWLPLYIRREENILQSLNNALFHALKQPKDSPNDPVALIQQLYYQEYKSIYLIFDQFEELYTIGKDKTEHSAFYQTIADILQAGLQAKVLIILREEWMAFLNDFEKVVPQLFDNRLRIEKMSEELLKEVIDGTLHTAEYKKSDGTIIEVDIQLPEEEAAIDAILNNLRDEENQQAGIALTNVQVYLDRLYRKATNGQSNKNTAIFSLDLINNQVGKMKNVLSEFIDEQLEALEADLQRGEDKTGQPIPKHPNPTGLPLEILFTLVTDNGTKQAVDPAYIQSRLPTNRSISVPLIEYCLKRFEEVRLLRQLQ